jgi:hypothetical protein
MSRLPEIINGEIVRVSLFSAVEEKVEIKLREWGWYYAIRRIKTFGLASNLR